eukprot:gnl/TRDRNA2_/TRDRNA2_200927_c0_seq1.p1 gnl/TRDRNA2_/TRDRNA2_200927_c0~~gnl/TRDRNA2_/TRDRNA2_200927_c0_seq1.p1  ORF type:complete len:302 (+),score=44.64 gnl/TRDRNA2_/TRDRNA2_200927_c0_seq1:60-908(+)
MAPGGGSEDMPKGLRFGLIATSCLISESATFPIDFTKTRMQLAVGKMGFFQALSNAVKTEGIGAVYAALPPAVMRHWIYTTLRISIYEDLRNYLAGGKGKESSAGVKLVSSFSAGGIAQAVASPADRLKVILVKEGGKRSLVQAARDVAANEGIKGFYVGVGPNVLRAALVNLGELATYDQAKRFVLAQSGLPDGVVVHTMSAFMSGFVASGCSTPADVIKSRVMGGQADGIVSCVRDIMKNEGWQAFTKGFIPNWVRLGPWQFFFWVSYEQLRKVSGYGGF